MPLDERQQKHLQNWMRSNAIIQCPACGGTQWDFAQASYVRALLERGEQDLAEERGVVRISCGTCGYVMLFDAQTLGIGGLWSEGRGI